MAQNWSGYGLISQTTNYGSVQYNSIIIDKI